MKWLIALIISFNMVIASEYWSVEEYFHLYPEQERYFYELEKSVKSTIEHLKDSPDRVLKISIIYPGNQASDYWRRSVESFEKRLKEWGVLYELNSHFTKPGIEIRKQAQQILQVMEQEIDYLIFTLDAKEHSLLINKILAKPSISLILQNITTPYKIWDGRQPFLYVGFDHGIGSEMLAIEYLKKIGKEGEYAVLFGPQGYVSDMRGNTFIRYMKKHSNLELVDSYYVGFDRERAKLATLELIERHKNLRFIYACSTDIALGAVDALREHGLIGKILVNGWGGGSAELEAIKKGELAMTVMRMNDDSGVAMADAIALSLEGNKKKIPTIYSGSFELVNESTREDELNRLKQRAFRYSGE